jgi:para-aminobenzoate synthetase/4-amino-4-deoxychorismate lyase
MAEVFALLDDRDATAERPSSRLYTAFVREHRCSDPGRFDTVWQAVDADLRAGLHAVLLADYEWGAKLLKAGHERLPAEDGSALRVLMFGALAHLSGAEADAWLEGQDPSAHAGAPSGVMNLQPSVDEAAFTETIARIHEAIRAGETYQVNYTYRLQGQAYGSPVGLYRRLRARQPVAFGAFIAVPAAAGGPGAESGSAEPICVLSCSPELFLRHDAGTLTARPMKGTASRAQGAEGDREAAHRLSQDVKTRAENLMIVDLLRNDLGRVAQIGSVKVPDLFVIEPYATVFQMTSTVQARLRADMGFADLLRAVYPCGSITGAPKHRTMQFIADLETTPRGLYCGAIGWMDAPAAGARVGSFCLSVAIRTLILGPEREGLRPLRLGVGAGIVQDSVAADEFEECRLKARFVTRLDPGFSLFETLHAAREDGARHVERHLSRLAGSATALGFEFDREALLAALHAAVQALPPGIVARLRLALAHDGRVSVTHAPLPPLPDGPVPLLISPDALPEHNPLSQHKTTARQHYDAGVLEAQRRGAFDSLFFTRSGRLAEGGRCNVFASIGGRWYTPPLADGALPGVMRAILLEDPAWAAEERTLTLGDLRTAESIIVCNALRGAIPASLAAEG